MGIEAHVMAHDPAIDSDCPIVDIRRRADTSDSKKIDFGRYAGWSIRDLVRQDPEYLRWLSRHSSGVRFRSEILRYMPAEAEETGAVRTPAR